MDIEEEYENNVFESHKIKSKVFEPLQVIVCDCFGLQCVILWNKFSFYLYESDRLSGEPIVYHFDKQVSKVDSVNNILLYKDAESALYFTILRHEETVDNVLIEKIRFKKIFDNVHDFFIGDEAIFIYRKDQQHILYIYNLVGLSKFKFSKKFILEPPLNNIDYKFYVKNLRYFSIDFIKCVLSIDTGIVDLDSHIVFFVNDDKVCTTVLQQSETNHVSLLHTCPVPIVMIGFEKKPYSALYLSLITGSMTILKCDIKSKCISMETIHLNCSIERIFLKDNLFFYTDSRKLWQTSIENDCTDEIKINSGLMKIRNAYDFYCDKNYTFYCTTLNNMLYMCKGKFAKCTSSLIKNNYEDYISVPKSLTETKNIFNELLEEFKQNETVLNNIEKENNLITIVALKQKSQLMMHHLLAEVEIFDDLNEVDYKLNNVSLITDLRQYYSDNLQIYVIGFKISEDFKSKFKEILSFDAGKWHLNVQLKSENHNQTLLLNVVDDNCIRIAVPVKKHQTPKLLDIKLIALIPNIYEEKVQIWCSLPSEPVLLNSKYHLTIPEIKEPKATIWQKENATIGEKIVKICHNNISSMYDINKIKNENQLTLAYFIRLPDNFSNEIDRFCEMFLKRVNHMSKKKINEALKQCLLSDNKPMKMKILNDLVDIQIIDEGTIKRIKLTGSNCNVCWDMYCCIRDSLRAIILPDANKFVPYFDFMKLQKIRDATNSVLQSDAIELSSLLKLDAEISRDFLGIIPL